MLPGLLVYDVVFKGANTTAAAAAATKDDQRTGYIT